MSPVVRTSVGGLHAKRLDLIDQLQDALDLGPTVCAQQNLTPWRDAGDGRVGFVRMAGAQNIDAGDEGSVVPGGPPDEGEHAVGPEPKGPTPTIENLFVRDMAEADPAQDGAVQRVF